MSCPHCKSTNILERKQLTNLGYKQFRCRSCCKYFNERTGTPFNFLQYPTDFVILVIFHYVRYKLSLVDVTELMALRGFSISHETVRQWVQNLGAQIGQSMKVKRKNKVGKKWHMDITYVYLENRWCYLYRAIDKSGNLVNVYLSDKRDIKAAKRFFKQCRKTTGVTPSQITTDKEPVLAVAIEDEFEESTKHRDVKYKNNFMEQNHRGTKSRLHVMKGSRNTWTAMIFCHIFEEFQDFFSTKAKSLAKHRGIIVSKFNSFMKLAQQIG